MPLIRCTKKLLTEMKAQVAPAAEQAQQHESLLGDWYARLLQIERKKLVIFTSERTLLTFLLVAHNRDAIRDLANFFQSGLRRLLEDEGFAPADVDRVLDDYHEMSLAPAADRSVLGSINDLARLAAAHIQDDGGLSACDFGAINHMLNLAPMGRLRMASPLAATRHVLEGGDLAAHSRGRSSPTRKKRPGRMKPDAVRIERRQNEAILTPKDPGVAVTHFHLGGQLAGMSDAEILDCFNATIDAQERLAAEHPYVATEVPPGRPQIKYSPEGPQWVPRGDVVRCLVASDGNGQPLIIVDDQELSLEDFGTLLLTYEGWGMRIEFTPDDETNRRPPLEIRDPDEPE